MISGYMESFPGIQIRTPMHLPRFAGREPLFDYVGLREVQGIDIAVGDAHGRKEATDLEYDKFFNTEEGGD
jgi:hypothetical protein